MNLEEVAQERAREGDVFYSTALEQGRIGDVQYALPTGVMPYMIYYNRTLLEERGLEDPQTVFREKRWDFSGFAAYLETARGSGEEPALAFEAEWESVEPFLRSQGGSCRVGENGIEPDALAEETAGTFGKLARQGVIRSCGGQEYADMQKAFAEGRLPMIVGGLEMTRLCSNVDFAWDILPFPSVESDFQNSSFEVPLIAAGNGEHGELARKFVSYYVSALGQKLRLENGECLIPSLNMVFYTSMGDVRFPEHSNYYFFAIENGYSSERAGVSETDRRRILDLWDGYMEEGT